MAIDIETVVQYNIVSLTTIERVIDRPEIFLKSFIDRKEDPKYRKIGYKKEI